MFCLSKSSPPRDDTSTPRHDPTRRENVRYRFLGSAVRGPRFQGSAPRQPVRGAPPGYTLDPIKQIKLTFSFVPRTLRWR